MMYVLKKSFMFSRLFFREITSQVSSLDFSTTLNSLRNASIGVASRVTMLLKFFICLALRSRFKPFDEHR